MRKQTNLVRNCSSGPLCSTGKVGYPNKAEASKFAQYLRQNYGAKIQRPYVCPECAQYHLSTTPHNTAPERTDK